MGQYINVGVATDIYITKGYKEELTVDQIKNIISKEMNIDIYNFEDEGNLFHLTLKPELFSKNILKLLEDEYKFIGYEKDKKEVNDVLEQIKNIPEDEILGELKEKNIDSWCCQFLEGYYMSDIGYILEHSYRIYGLHAYADMVVYFYSGKVILEEYYYFLKYTRNKIIASMDNPLKDAIFVSIF